MLFFSQKFRGKIISNKWVILYYEGQLFISTWNNEFETHSNENSAFNMFL